MTAEFCCGIATSYDRQPPRLPSLTVAVSCAWSHALASPRLVMPVHKGTNERLIDVPRRMSWAIPPFPSTRIAANAESYGTTAEAAATAGCRCGMNVYVAFARVLRGMRRDVVFNARIE
ncbi:hypothetical protein RRF57_007820 [Xylaria bambusicola]|uniref:Uncharacterized protein n=1 Tax=Xylaria bambusicola TaxID=326684 RepID=A0AAN7ZAN4_9PEZI